MRVLRWVKGICKVFEARGDMPFNSITSSTRCRAELVGLPHPTSDVVLKLPIPPHKALKVVARVHATSIYIMLVVHYVAYQFSPTVSNLSPIQNTGTKPGVTFCSIACCNYIYLSRL